MTPEQIETHLDLWPTLAGGTATLINLSENHTFRIDHADGRKHILRVHRPGYQQDAAILSELGWVAALRADTDIPVPEALPGRDGALLQRLGVGNEARRAVLFAFEEGAEPRSDGDLSALFGELGAMAAKCHAYVARWTPPAGFVRPVWNAEAILSPEGLWGNWREAPNLDPQASGLIARLETRLRADLAAYGSAADRFGLIHADMRLANLLVGGPKGTVLIDFDDSGFGWLMYDFGAAVSFFEDSPQLPVLAASWLEGYRAVRPLADEHAEMLGAMVMLRRMALLAWVGSHHETDLARSLAPRYAPGTAELADRYLSNRLGL